MKLISSRENDMTLTYWELLNSTNYKQTSVPADPGAQDARARGHSAGAPGAGKEAQCYL